MSQTPPDRSAAHDLPFTGALPATGELSALVLDSQLRVAGASQGCRILFERDPEAMIGVPLSELVEAPALEPAEGSADGFAHRSGRSVRVKLFWRRGPQGTSLTLLNLETLQRNPFLEAAGLGRFASMVTHEVRNPLSSVKMVVQTLARGSNLDERGRRRMGIASKEIRTIERILSALSELAHHRRRAPASGPLDEAVAAALEAVRPELQERGLAADVQLAEGLPAVRSDERLAMALAHLLAVCAHPLPEGAKVTLRAEPAPGGVLLTVSGPPPGGSLPSGTGISVSMIEAFAADFAGRFEQSPSGQPAVYRLFLPAA